MVLFHMGALRFGLSAVQALSCDQCFKNFFLKICLYPEHMRAEKKRSVSEFCPKSLRSNGLPPGVPLRTYK